MTPKIEEEPPLILIADDSPTALKLTSSVLLKSGYRVTQVTDGEEAINSALKLRPDALVVDLKMPKKNGYEVCQSIKSHRDFFIPILLLTAKEDVESMVKGLESGADDYIIKPFNEMEFIARVKVLLRLKKLNDELLKANSRLKYLSTHDENTGLYNHRYFFTAIEILLEKLQEKKGNVCLAIFDIDYFKSVNDKYGHLEGDRILKKVAEHLSHSFTEDTILARYGGEEFAAIFPNRPLSYVVEVCQKVLKERRKIIFESHKQKFKVTLSGGITSTEYISNLNVKTLIIEADQFLYASKNKGRDRLTYPKIL